MVFLNKWIKIFGRSLLLTYIDAGTGSLIIQVIIGSLAGSLLILKMSWKRVKNWIRHNPPAKEKLEEGKERTVE